MIRFVVLVGLSSLACVQAASAQQPGYVGRWANEASWCRNTPGTTDELPVRFSARGFEGFEIGCRFDRIRGGAGEWDISATCHAEGMIEKRRITLRREGEALVWIERNQETQRMVRCG